MKLIQFLIKIPIFKRLLPSLIRRVFMLLKIFLIKFNYKNVELILDIRDSIDRVILFNNKYEEEQMEYFFKCINNFEMNIFIDIGANIGVYSLLAAKRFRHVDIYSYEPHPEAFKRLAKNIINNNFENRIVAINLALSNFQGKMFIEGPKNLGINQSGGATLSSTGSNEILVKTGDSDLQLLNEKIAIKIDVEGHEHNVIEGLKNILVSNSIFIQIEIFDRHLEKVSKTLKDLNFKLVKKISHNHSSGTNDYYYKNF